MTLLVKNECDIVRQNIDFHLSAGVDHIVAIDNVSSDGTRDILAEYERRGLASVVNEPGQDYSQSAWVTSAALMARDKLDADWILNNDADEFWFAPSGDLKQVIASATSRKLICQRHNMLFACDDGGEKHWADKAQFRITEPLPFKRPKDIFEGSLPAPYLYLKLPPKVLLGAHNLRSIRQGNHDAEYETNVSGSDSPITIYHFPVRSRKQFELKVTQGGQAYARNSMLAIGVGWHWRRWYHMLQTEGLDAVMADVLPSSEKLQQDLKAGILRRDRHIPRELGLQVY